MQNLEIIRDFPLNSFLTTSAVFRRPVSGIATLLLWLVGMTVQAQVATPGATGAGTSAPAATPSSSPASRGAALPAGVNNLPASVQQQIRAAQGNQGTNQTNGRTGTTTNQTTGRDGQAPANTNADGSVENQDKSTEPNTEVIEDGYAAARRREREEIRQKLFGFALFNDPAQGAAFAPNPASMATPRSYIIGPGDELNIRLYGYSEGDYSQKVSPEGAIYIAGQTGIGPISVSGLTVEQAKGRIISRMARKFVGLRSSSYGAANTFLEISLGGIRSIRITVTGDAVKPGTFTMSSLSTAMNAIYQAGGPNELGSFRKVQLIRNNKVLTTLDLYDYLLNGTQRNDFRLQDNDNIRFTTYIERVEITGTVKRNNIFEMLPGETLDRLLYYAGDFAANAYKDRIKVTRLTNRERKVIDVTTPEFKAFVMQDGDLVTVEQLLDRFENQITIDGAVFRPGKYSLDQNKTLKQLITTAEGLKGDAYTGRVLIVRTREDLALENLSVNLADILAGTAQDVPLQREDQIIVSSRFDLAESATVSVQGEVNQPNSDIPFMSNMTLNDVLLRTGGFKESAAVSLVEIVRRKKDVDPKSTSAQVAQIFRLSVDRNLAVDNNNFLMEPFDQVIVRRSPNYLVQTYASVDGEVIVPGAYAIRSKDQKISDLITLAGGLTPRAYVEGATLVRIIRLSPDEIARRKQSVQDLADDPTGKVIVETDSIVAIKPESIGINLKRILAKPGSSEDILVQEGDLLRIPKLLETVRVQGEVLQPNTVKYRSGQTFQDYISQAGGFTSRSQRRKSYVMYANGSIDRTRKFMFFNIYPRVEPGADVIIPRRVRGGLTPQQILSSTVGIAGSLLTLVTTILVLTRVR